MHATTGSPFYGWWIVAVAFLVIGVTNGLALGGLQVFDGRLIAELGIERGVLKDRDAIILVLSALLAPFTGALADRYGTRPMLSLGCVLLAIAMYGYSRATDMNDLRLASAIAGGCLASAGLVICVNVVSRWFVTYRGAALGLMLAGTSVGNALMPQVNVQLIEAYGWRGAFAALAFVPLALVPLIWLVLREWPRDRGLEPLGAAAGGVASTAQGGMGDLLAALRTANFWLIAGIAFATFYAILGTNANIFLHLRDLGLADQVASQAFLYIFLPGLLGKVVAGWLADRYGRQRTFLCLIATMLLGALLLASMRAPLVWPALLLYGLGWGGLYTMLQLLTAEIFGTRSLGKILGAIVLIDAAGGAAGQKLTAVFYDSTGSYSLSFGIIAGLVAIALILATLVRVPPRPAL